MPAQGYYSDQQYISQEEQFNAFGMAKDLAIMSLNPFNWYRYNPSMFSVTRGQVRLATAGSWWGKKAVGLVGKIPGVAKNPRFQDVQRAMSEPQWYGLSPKGWTNPKTGRRGLGMFPFMGNGIEDLGPPTPSTVTGEAVFEVDVQAIERGGVVNEQAAREARQTVKDYKKKRRAAGKSTRGAKTQRRRYRDAFAANKRRLLNQAREEMLESVTVPQPNMLHTPQSAADAMREAYYRKNNDFITDRLTGKSSKKNFRTYKWNKTSRLQRIKATALRGASTGSRMAGGLVSGASRVARAEFVRALGRGAVRGGIAFAKGFAYFELAKLAWDTINMFAEPIGRSMVAQADASLQQFKSIARPELGGSIAMGYMSRGAATERQRALAAISKSQLNARSAMGNEASMLHM